MESLKTPSVTARENLLRSNATPTAKLAVHAVKGISAVIACVAVIVTVLSMVVSAGKSDVADAAMRGDGAAVRALIGQKADVNAPQNDGATALHWAVYRGDRELVQ